MNFGSVAVGSKATLSGALINSSTASATVKGVSVNGTSYAFGGLSFPFTIAPGQSVTFDRWHGEWKLRFHFETCDESEGFTRNL